MTRHSGAMSRKSNAAGKPRGLPVLVSRAAETGEGFLGKCTSQQPEASLAWWRGNPPCEA